MIRNLRIIVILSALLHVAVVALAQEGFVIGVAPHTSARVIMEMYQPLRLYLEVRTLLKQGEK